MDRERPTTGEALNEGAPTIPRPSASVILLRDADRRLRAAARRAQPGAALHGRLLGLPGRRRRRARGRRRGGAPRGRRPRAARGGRRGLDRRSRASSPTAAGSRPSCCESASTRASSSPARRRGRSRDATVTSASASAGAPRARCSATTSAGTSGSPSRRCARSSSSSAFATAGELFEHAATHEIRPILPRVVRTRRDRPARPSGRAGGRVGDRPTRCVTDRTGFRTIASRPRHSSKCLQIRGFLAEWRVARSRRRRMAG